MELAWLAFGILERVVIYPFLPVLRVFTIV